MRIVLKFSFLAYILSQTEIDIYMWKYDIVHKLIHNYIIQTVEEITEIN